jgi:16S rRNA (adenine1518-N6/adenine1519-N6)-dimethyltransferase
MVTPSLERDQAFMVDRKALKWIVEQAGLKKTDTVLEIGAGTGNLTRELARSGARVIAVEKDIALEEELRRRLARLSNVEVVIGDALRLLDLREFRFDKLVSNIPYAISEALIQRLVFHEFELGVLTLPKSFASRLVAAQWEKQYSRLSFIFQCFFMVRDCLDLQRDAFRPVPKTNSVALSFISKPRNSLVCQIFLRPEMKAGNAFREALCSSMGMTKNQARLTINRLKPIGILDKKVSELSLDEVKQMVSRAASVED